MTAFREQIGLRCEATVRRHKGDTLSQAAGSGMTRAPGSNFDADEKEHRDSHVVQEALERGLGVGIVQELLEDALSNKQHKQAPQIALFSHS